MDGGDCLFLHAKFDNTCRLTHFQEQIELGAWHGYDEMHSGTKDYKFTWAYDTYKNICIWIQLTVWPHQISGENT